MKGRIAMWASVGFLVAACWAVYAFVTPPESFWMNLRQPVVQAALYLSCPIAYVGRYYPSVRGGISADQCSDVRRGRTDRRNVSP